MKQSKSGDLNRQDYIKWGWNTLIFLAPALVVLFTSVADVIPSDAKYGALLLYVLNILVDFLRKMIKGK